MNNDITELVFILDRSGSMSGKEEDVVGGYNSFIARQLKEPGRTIVTTVLFNDRYKILHNGAPAETALMTRNDYHPTSGTALLDAVGKTISFVSEKIVNTPKELRPNNVIFVITTDGMENSSVYFSRERVRKLIELKKTNRDWSFIFLGADIDAYSEAGGIGITDRRDVYAYDSRKVSNTQIMGVACERTCSIRADKKNRILKDLL